MEHAWIVPVSETAENDARICGGDIDSAEISLLHQTHNQPESPGVWFIFNGVGSQWAGMGTHLMEIQTCKESLEKLAAILKPKNLDLLDILINGKDETFDNVLHSFVSIAAIQIALVDLLTSLKIKPDGIIGHSIGELGAAYADGCLTAEQVILTAHARGQAILEMGPGGGAMAAVGISWEEAKKKCPPGIYPACHNSKDSVTVSGPAELIDQFVDQLQREGIFARKVNSSGQAFHSPFIEPAQLKMKESLEKIIPVPTARSKFSRWISSSISESRWNSELAKTSSADYHVNNLISPVLFREALEKVPSSAVVIEIGPHCLLQSILKRSLPSCSHIGLVNKNHKDGVVFLCQSIGKIFTLGLNPASDGLDANKEAPCKTLEQYLISSISSSAAQTKLRSSSELKKIGGKTPGDVCNLNESESESENKWLLSIAQVLGMENADLENNCHGDFESLGMDSFMCREIKQMVEITSGCVFTKPTRFRHHQIFLSPKCLVTTRYHFMYE